MHMDCMVLLGFLPHFESGISLSLESEVNFIVAEFQSRRYLKGRMTQQIDSHLTTEMRCM